MEKQREYINHYLMAGRPGHRTLIPDHDPLLELIEKKMLKEVIKFDKMRRQV